MMSCDSQCGTVGAFLSQQMIVCSATLHNLEVKKLAVSGLVHPFRYRI